MSRKADLITGIVFLAFSAIFYFYLIPTQIVRSVPAGHLGGSALRPDFFPRMTVVLIALLSVFLITGALKKEGEGTSWPGRRSLFQVGMVFFVTYIYTIALDFLGFLVASPIYLAVLMNFLGLREWRYVVSVSILLPLALRYFFWYSFYVVLPEWSLF